MQGIMSVYEIASMIKHLIEYQKEKDWSVYRKKIPEDLLVKWAQVLAACRKHGFVGPKAFGDRIHWNQVVTHREKPSDKCTMCPRGFGAFDCKGKTGFRKDGNKDFLPCWIY